jgi:hypothetical protein
MSAFIPPVNDSQLIGHRQRQERDNSVAESRSGSGQDKA